MVVDKKLQEELGLRKIKEDEVTDSQNKKSKLEYVMIDELAFGGVEAVEAPGSRPPYPAGRLADDRLRRGRRKGAHGL